MESQRVRELVQEWEQAEAGIAAYAARVAEIKRELGMILGFLAAPQATVRQVAADAQLPLSKSHESAPDTDTQRDAWRTLLGYAASRPGGKAAFKGLVDALPRKPGATTNQHVERVRWSLRFMLKPERGYITKAERGYYQVTDAGYAVLNQSPNRMAVGA